MSVVSSPIDARRATELLASLVKTDSINPMGRAPAPTEPVERKVLQVIEDWLTPYRDRLSFERQPCNAIHESLIVRLEGKDRATAALFESHADTVPADDWADRALTPRLEDGRLYGRGACDDKGSLAAMLLALADLIEHDVTPPRSVVLVCAGDEEFAQTGIRSFRQQSQERFAYGVFGEPTELHPVVQHKGTVRWDIIVHGTSAHTARPELGENAILGMVEVVNALAEYQARLQQRWTNQYMTGPLATVTKVQGGRTRNATADECTIAVDFRILPGMVAEDEKRKLTEFLRDRLTWKLTHRENQLMTPPLNTDPKSPFCSRLLEICREVTGRRLQLRGEPYGTDAAWVSDLCPAVVLGPGDIAHAHAVDEWVAIDEVVRAAQIYREIMTTNFKFE